MKTPLTTLIGAALLTACSMGSHDVEDPNVLTAKFKSTLNIYETVSQNDDGTLTYKSVPWGGLIGSVRQHNLPVDWSSYEAVVVKFSKPTKVETQLLVSDRYKAFGKPGITTLTCNFDGQDMSSIDQVTLQTADSGAVNIKEVRLIPTTGTWKTIPLRTFQCEFGDWQNGFTLKPELFDDAKKGDKLEFIYTTDTNTGNVYNWLIKTIYNGTETTLEGNANALNKWGCAPVGRRSTVYRIPLTAQDVVNLKKVGAFVNGRYLNISQINLLRQESQFTSTPADTDNP